MKVSVNWLKTLVDIDLSIDELAHTLTMAGLEVEEITPVAPFFNQIVVAEVKAVSPHPNADKLRVTEVDAGTGSLLQIVCGAPNVAVGMRVPCALVGAKLPGLEIKAAKLRGMDSNGMLCSARELGLSDDHGGLLALPADAPIGQDIRDYLDLNDVILTLKLTPNRGDCLSMIGIARDLAAVIGASAKLQIPAIEPVASGITESRAITLSAGKSCTAYLGRVIKNINAKAATPEWMKRRLERAGFRSIAPLVDITNYLTLERGRPMHAFDHDKLKGDIEVRWAQSGEEMNLLNEQHVILKPDMLLIADEAGAVAMGGVMGGLESMVSDVTTNVFFEAAHFHPDAIQGKTRELGINSDAAYRFERGVDPASVRDGIEYATALTIQICGTPNTQVGPVTEAIIDAPPKSPVPVRTSRVNTLIGMNIEIATIAEIFKRLQCLVTEIDGEGSAPSAVFSVTPPSYRFDLNIEADFVEEIARIYGYEKVPSLPPRSSIVIMPIPEDLRTRAAIRHSVADLGYQEVINYSFVPETWETDFCANINPVRLSNPIASHMSVMRTSLIGGLILSLKNNLNRGETRLRLFEVGRCFNSAEATLDAQPEQIGGLAYGPMHAEQWGEDKSTKVDFFAVKGDLESLLQGTHARFDPLVHPALHPGRSAAIYVDDKFAGFLGELHPRWQQHYELPAAPVVFELAIAALAKQTSPHYKPISRMQAVRRDTAFIVSETVAAQDMIDTVLGLKLTNVADFSLFDLYRGANLPAGQKSLAFRIVMQDTERTLTDSECDQIVFEIVEAMSKQYGATIRK